MTEQRKYSLAEIGRMRQAIMVSYPTGMAYNASERISEIEDRLRTYMMNGTDPEELEAVARQVIDWEMARHRTKSVNAP